jgi:hypothetical protein
MQKNYEIIVTVNQEIIQILILVIALQVVSAKFEFGTKMINKFSDFQKFIDVKMQFF